MADVYFRSNDLAQRDTAVAHQFEEAIRLAAEALPEPPAGRLGCRIVTAGPESVSIQFDLPGWVQVFPVPATADEHEVEARALSALRWKLGPAAPPAPRARVVPRSADVTPDPAIVV